MCYHCDQLITNVSFLSLSIFQALNLTSLNYDCLKAILGHLQLVDLVNVAQSGRKFKLIAETVFTEVHNATIKLEYDANSFVKQQKVLQYFGRLAQKVEVDMPVNPKYYNDGDTDSDDSYDSDDDDGEYIFHRDGDKVLRSIAHFCGVNVKELSLSFIQIRLRKPFYSHKDFTDVIMLLNNLCKLTLISACTSADFFQHTKSLTELNIHNGCPDNKLFETTFPKLMKLMIGNCGNMPFNFGHKFNDFLNKNRSLKKLCYTSVELEDGYLESMCSLPRLTFLHVPVSNDTDLSPIARARKLKNLIFQVMPDDLRQFSALCALLPNGCKFSTQKWEIRHH